MEEMLERLHTRLPGCRIAAIVGMDGLLVESYPELDSVRNTMFSMPTAGLQHVASDLTSAFQLLAGEPSKHLGDRVDEVLAISSAGGYVARRFGDELFCFVIVNATVDMTRARRELEAVTRRLASELT